MVRLMTEPLALEGIEGQELRGLLKAARTRLGLTQRAAARRAGIDASWWKKLEGGTRQVTQLSTMAAMCIAVGISPGALESIGHPKLADHVRMAKLAQADAVTAEEHLAQTPGTSPHERHLLILMLRAIRSPDIADPFADRVRGRLRD